MFSRSWLKPVSEPVKRVFFLFQRCNYIFIAFVHNEVKFKLSLERVNAKEIIISVSVSLSFFLSLSLSLSLS